MLFEDKRWKEEQLLRRMNFQDPTASERTRERINRARREACMQYFEGEDAVKDTLQLEEERRKGLSLREHRETHRAEKLSTAEKEFRAKMKKGSPSYRTKTNGVRVA